MKEFIVILGGATYREILQGSGYPIVQSPTDLPYSFWLQGIYSCEVNYGNPLTLIVFDNFPDLSHSYFRVTISSQLSRVMIRPGSRKTLVCFDLFY